MHSKFLKGAISNIMIGQQKKTKKTPRTKRQKTIKKANKKKQPPIRMPQK